MPTKQLFLDIETFSSAPLAKCGVYRYCDSPDFQILLVSYAYDNDPITIIDPACGENIPEDFIRALEDPNIIKYAHNAIFERVCFSKLLGHWLDPHQWRCTLVWASYLTMPASLADAAVALNVTEKKMEEGKDLIRYFSIPCKPTKTNGGRTRNLPRHAPDKWSVYRHYNMQDVETERALVRALEAYPMPESEWDLYALDQAINDRGVRVDRLLVKQAMAIDSQFTSAAYQRAKELTGLDNPGSVIQLKSWLADRDMPMESMAKKIVQEKAANADGIVGDLLSLRLELSKTSVKKYESMARCVCRDGRVHGTLQFYGANKTGRWCLTGDHEVLTRDGWQRLDDWQGGPIACWNASTDAISFSDSKQLCFDYTGPMYTYRDVRIDQCSTPDHKMRVQRVYGSEWQDMTVEEMAKCRPSIPMFGYRYHRGCANPTWLRVLIMTQADGNYTADGSVRYGFKKQRKIERCKHLLRRAEIPFVINEYADRTCITVHARFVPLWLREFRTKTFGFWLLDENPDIFFDELPYWDGYYPAPNSIQYATCNKQNADIVQALAHMSGRTAIIKTKRNSERNPKWQDSYVVDIWLAPKNAHEIKAKPEVTEYSGKVYCAETSTGYFLVRRNGKVWVTGNSGRLVQMQNLAQSHLPDLALAREIVKHGDMELLEMMFGSVPNTLSELIRTAFIPKDGCRFIVADFSAIEARVLAWLAGEEWVLEEFRGKGKIYEATASRMFHIPQETIVKGHPNYEYRQKGKQATLSCIAMDSLVLTDAGPMPIQNVTKAHRVWDGTDWVHHDGVIPKGRRAILRYDGLAATPDHLVYVEGQAEPIAFGIAAERHMRLQRIDRSNSSNSSNANNSANSANTMANSANTMANSANTTSSSNPSNSSNSSNDYPAEIISDFANVYDILNAGPKHRFTVSGCLVHNCGYGGGVNALKAMGAKMPEEEMQPLVDAWRAANPRIVALWRAMDRAARQVTEQHISVRVGRIRLYWRDDKMIMRLPSGRELFYLSPRIVVNRFGNPSVGFMVALKGGKMALQETWGATLVENATQATARDLLANGMLNLEARGYHIVFHVHDECVMEVPIGFGSLDDACQIMSIQPDWAQDLPLRADGAEMMYYQKS